MSNAASVPAHTGAYEIYVIDSPRHWYVGAAYGVTSSAAKRFDAHVKGRGGARQLADAINVHGPEFFTQAIVETGFGDPIAAEAAWYDKLLAVETRRCLNGMRPGRLNGHTPRMSDEHRAKISASKKGKPLGAGAGHFFPHSEESKQKMSDAHKGVSLSLAHRANIGAASKGKPSGSTRTLVECKDCDLVTTPLAYGNHRKATGHTW